MKKFSLKQTGALALVVVACVFVLSVIMALHDYYVPDNFGVVVPGDIFRSGQLLPHQLERVIRKYGIRTILRTNDTAKDASPEIACSFAEICRENRVRIVDIPMYGDGVALFEDYDRAVEVLNTPTNRPILICCARGTHRTGAIISSFRVISQGWPVEKALKEMTEYRFKPVDSEGKTHRLVPHLMEYLESRSREK